MLIANRTFDYAGKRIRAGEQFQARNGRDERLLTAIKHARVVVDDSAPQAAKSRKGAKAKAPNTYERRDMVAQPPAPPTAGVLTITGSAPLPQNLEGSAVGGVGVDPSSASSADESSTDSDSSAPS